jgi:NAD(P)H-dependent FMN reductase
MGMPVITPGAGSRCQAVTDLIQSVALQEAALSHILNAEGEKIQKIIQSGATQEQLLELNDSIFKLVSAVTRLEMMFQAKLEMFTNENPCAPATAAADEFKKIIIPALSIDIPLDAPEAPVKAAELALAAARALVSPGFSVTFVYGDYVPGTLTGRFTVTSSADPTDTASDTAGRTIAVAYAPAALGELAKISVPSVSVNIPLDDSGAEAESAAQAVAAAQVQVAPGYTATFIQENYIITDTLARSAPTGTLTGKFTVANDAVPADKATDATSRTITITTNYVPAAQAELDQIIVFAVEIDLPLGDGGAEAEAAAKVIEAASAQVSQGYGFVFTPVSYTPGTLKCRFTIKNETYPTDTATEERVVTITTTYIPATGELAKIDVASVIINIPLYVGEAEAEAAAQAEFLAQGQVSDGYKATFAPAGYFSVDPTGTLTGWFTVTNGSDPSDTATDTAEKRITVTTAWLPRAQEELDKINVTEVTIDVPFGGKSGIEAAALKARDEAQKQVSPGYRLSYNVWLNIINGMFIRIKFTAENEAYPRDIKMDADERIIAVITTWRPAMNELAKINVPGFVIGIPLDSGTATGVINNLAASIAQSQVSSGYTVKFATSRITAAMGTVLGNFTVTNTADSDDTATDRNSRSMMITYTPTTRGG